MEGTKCSTLMRSSQRIAFSCAGSRWAPGAAITSVAPVISGQKNSHTETSKPNGVFCSTRSLPSMRNCACIHCRRLHSAAWLLPAPFGRPVVPEV
ncbi:hypothetical protein D9M69_166870 [compost metagenome]